MDWLINAKKAGLGALTTLAAFLVANSGIVADQIGAWVAAAIAAVIVSVANWVKHKAD